MLGRWLRLCAGAALIATAAVLALPATAGASTEEFSTFDPLAQELDDESVVDHLLTRFPGEWREEWERSPNAVRISQGCLTSAFWSMETGLRARAPLGDRAHFELFLDQYETDRASWNNLELWFRFPQAWGTMGVMLRPYAEKSRHDMALAWSTGADTSAFQLEAIYGLEDLFNNLWAFRQSQVGGRSEPYRRHPWEPALRVAVRRARWRAEVAGRYLTPSDKRLVPFGPGAPRRIATLWGAHGNAAVELRAAGVAWDARAENWQARSTEQPEDLSVPDGRRFRRSWSVELGARARPAPRLTAEARGMYVARSADDGPPVGPGRFEAADRVAMAELRWAALPALTLRLGGLYDRIGIAAGGPRSWMTYGTRTESRAYFGFAARFGRFRVAAVEGVELDPEPYEVNFHHDKAFAQVQTTF